MPSPGESATLTVAEFHILVALADAARHGYGIMRDVEEQTEGAVRLGPGTLYTALRRMSDRGFVEETRATGDKTNAGHADTRRIHYKITRNGRDAALAEARRMERCLDLVRTTRLARRLEHA